MKATNRIRILIFALVMFFGVGAINTFAQADDPTLAVCEQIADKAKRLEIENVSLKSQLQLEKDKVSLERERATLFMDQRDFYKTAYEKVGKVDTNSQMVIDNLRVQVNDFRIELADLRRENDKLRSSRNFRSYVTTALGFGAGYYIGNKK